MTSHSVAADIAPASQPASPQSQEIIQAFIALYQSLGPEQLPTLRHRLQAVYAPEICFCDPMHRLEGLEQLEQYFAGLYRNLTEIAFEITDVLPTGDQAAISWQMKYCHPKLNRGQSISVDGISLIKFGDKIHYHRDYLDLGQMLYEQLPLLGSVVRMVKGRASR